MGYFIHIISLRHALALLLMAALLMAPAFFTAPQGSDLYCQALWVKLFSEQFWSGDIYPRWLMNAYAGRGSPAFFYYPPLIYYITSFFTLLRPLDHLGYTAIAASGFLGLFVSGVMFYIWIRQEGVDAGAALLGALLYQAAPYHVAHAFYFMMLLSFFWSFAWLPLLLMSAKKIALGARFAVPAFAISLCMLVMTNLPMTLIMGPVSVAYALLYFARPTLGMQSARLALAMALGFGLAAFYILPMTSYLHFAILKRQWTEDSTDFHNFFLTTDFGNFGNLVFSLAAFMVSLLIIVYAKCAQRRSREFLFFSAISGMSIFMLLPLSRPVWESMNILRIIQFPQRLFAVSALGLAVLASLTMPRLRLLGYSLLMLYGGITLIVPLWPREHEQYAETYFALGIEQHANYMTSYDLVEKYYAPQGTEYVKAHMDPVEIAHGKADIQVKQWKPRDIVMDYQAHERSILRVRQFYFPGWHATQEGQTVRLGREGNTGQVLLDVPEGSGEIHLVLEALEPEKQGALISSCSLLLILAITTWFFLREESPIAPKTVPADLEC